MEPKRVTDIAALAEHFGSLAAFAAFFGVNAQTAWNWINRTKQLPMRLFFEQDAKLRAAGLDVPRSVWGFDPILATPDHPTPARASA